MSLPHFFSIIDRILCFNQNLAYFAFECIKRITLLWEMKMKSLSLLTQNAINNETNDQSNKRAFNIMHYSTMVLKIRNFILSSKRFFLSSINFNVYCCFCCFFCPIFYSRWEFLCMNLLGTCLCIKNHFFGAEKISILL